MYAFKIDNILIVEYWIISVEKIKKESIVLQIKQIQNFLENFLFFFMLYIYFFVYYYHILLQIH